MFRSRVVERRPSISRPVVRIVGVIGTYPTAVEHLAGLSTPTCDLWVKRDDQTHPGYGGNKVRKLEHLVAEAQRRGARRIVTIGAAGSHHVLATTLHAGRAGLGVAAILMHQPWSAHAAANLRAGLALGLEAHPASGMADLLRVLARIRREGDWVVPPGGSNIVGTCGYVDGARELAAQIRAGACPEPEVIVVALGSGGTAAGLLAGVVAEGLATRVLAVRIVGKALAGGARTTALAIAAARRSGLDAGSIAIARRLEVDGSWLGRGYGWPTQSGDEATARAGEAGLALDPTYTAKTFAAALALVERGAARRVLYWHTLSSAPLEPLLAGAPSEAELPSELARLFVREAPRLPPPPQML